MKKIFLGIMISLLCMFSYNVVFAANEYTFDVEYTGNVVVNQEKDVDVLLIGTEAPVHNKVIIKVDISGPATPSLIAYDSQGTRFDIAQIGYWGPETGFQVGGTFTNRTPVKAIFTEVGTYTITLSLLDLENANAVITTKTVNVNVFEDNVSEEPAINNIVNTIITNNTIEELPKAGVSIGEYLICITLFVMIIGYGYWIISKNKKSY